jgi:hypothetical protein
MRKEKRKTLPPGHSRLNNQHLDFTSGKKKKKKKHPVIEQQPEQHLQRKRYSKLNACTRLGEEQKQKNTETWLT